MTDETRISLRADELEHFEFLPAPWPADDTPTHEDTGESLTAALVETWRRYNDWSYWKINVQPTH